MGASANRRVHHPLTATVKPHTTCYVDATPRLAFEVSDSRKIEGLDEFRLMENFVFLLSCL